MNAIAIIGFVIALILVFVPPLWDRDNWQKSFGVNIPPICDWISNQWVRISAAAIGGALLAFFLLRREVLCLREQIKNMKEKILEIELENRKIKSGGLSVNGNVNVTNNSYAIMVSNESEFEAAVESFKR